MIAEGGVGLERERQKAGVTYIYSVILAHAEAQNGALAEDLYIRSGFKMVLEGLSQSFYAILE